jgi:hypothetical protein
LSVYSGERWSEPLAFPLYKINYSFDWQQPFSQLRDENFWKACLKQQAFPDRVIDVTGILFVEQITE